MRTLTLLCVAFGAWLICGAAASAQRGPDAPFRRAVFEPELLMAHQRKIGLTPEQRGTFIREMQQTQSDLLPVQLEMSEASTELIELLEGPRIDEEAALAAARRVLELERRVKSRHMLLLIRIKNLLTEEQQHRLRQLRDSG